MGELLLMVADPFNSYIAINAFLLLF